MTSSEIVPSTGRPLVTPLAQMEHRLPEAGRIRLGEKRMSKGGKEYPAKLNTFRFTSHDRDALEALAHLHGGKVTEWKDGPRAGEYQLTSQATKIEVALPPVLLSQHYELWSKGGCQRRCDGVTFQTSRPTPDGAEVVDAPCQCLAQNRFECKATSRLTVVIRGIPFGGGWLLTTGGWTAALELPGMVELIQMLQGRGLTTALLVLKEASKVVQVSHKQCRGNGCGDCKNTGVVAETRKWMVPALALPNTIDELASGAAQLGALASGRDVRALAIDAPLVSAEAALDADARALPPPDDVLDENTAHDIARYGSDSDGPVDAEIVDETEGGAGGAHRSEGAEAEPEGDVDTHADGAHGSADAPTRMRRKLHALVNECVKKGGPASGVDADRFRHAAVRTATGIDQSSGSLIPDELARVLDLLSSIVDGKVRFMGISEHGQIRTGE